MNDAKSDAICKLIIQHNACSTEKKKEQLRNQIFNDILPDMMKWISAILSGKGIFKSKEEIISKSWDCFEFCLKYYKPGNPISVPKHFYRYTNFFLKTNPIEGLYESSEESLSSLKTEPDTENIYSDLEELKSFRKDLPEKYTIVFDDALVSMSASMRNRLCRIEESGLSSIRYQESKKIFKWVIEFLLKR